MRITEVKLGKRYLVEIPFSHGIHQIEIIEQTDNYVKISKDNMSANWYALINSEIKGTDNWRIIQELPDNNSGKQMIYG